MLNRWYGKGVLFEYSIKPPLPLQVTKGLKAGAGGGFFFSPYGKKAGETGPAALDFSS